MTYSMNLPEPSGAKHANRLVLTAIWTEPPFFTHSCTASAIWESFLFLENCWLPIYPPAQEKIDTSTNTQAMPPRINLLDRVFSLVIPDKTLISKALFTLSGVVRISSFRPLTALKWLCKRTRRMNKVSLSLIELVST